MQEKTTLRKTLLHERSSHPPLSVGSYCINLRIWKFIQSFGVKDILVYYPLEGEVNLMPLYSALWRSGYNIYFPLTQKQDNLMFFYKCDSLLSLAPSNLTLYEPCDPNTTDIFSAEQKALVIVPSLALDKNGARLGFGKGYYDRFLHNFPHLIKIAPQFSSMIFDKLPTNVWDIAMDITISEKKTLDLRR